MLLRDFMRGAVCASILAYTASMPLLAHAAYPDHPVQILVGFPPGTGPDIVARLLAQKLSEKWHGASVLVQNKPGAGGLIAATEAAHARPDGYTLLLGDIGELAIDPNSYTHLNYNVKRDFVPISQVVTSAFALLVSRDKVPPASVKQFVDWANRSKHGKLFMGSFGAGTPGHFGTYIFGKNTGLDIDVVQYRNTSDAIVGTVNGDVAGTFATVGLSAPNVRGGKLRAIGITGDHRNPLLPDVPTFKEQGYPGVQFSSWYGMVAPTGTPKAIISQLERDIRAAIHAGNGAASLKAAGFEATGTTAVEFGKFIDAETARWGKIVKATGFKIN